MAKKRGIQTHSFAPNPYYVELPESIPGIPGALIPVIFIVVAFVALFAISVHAWTYQQPTENFDINTTSGVCTYRPLNATWLDLDGNTNFVNITSAIKGMTPSAADVLGYTVVINLRYYNMSAGERALGFGNQVAVRILGNTTSFNVYCGNKTGLMTTPISFIGKPYGNWTTIGIEYNMSYCFAYMNGVYQTGATFISSNVTFDNTKMLLGRSTSDAVPQSLNGSIDEVLIYNRSLYNAKVHTELYYRTSNNLGWDDGVPVVLFHNINEAGLSTSINTTQFDSYMNASYNAGMHTITVADYFNYRRGTFTLPSKPFIITFDDGDISIYTNASPILIKYRYKATLFMITNKAGAAGYMSWSQMQDLVNKGWEIGSHTQNHINLTSISYASVNDELLGSKNAIIGNISITPVSMSCPYSIHNATIDTQIANYYNISFCDYWSIPGETIQYLHNFYPLVGTNNSRGDISNISTVRNFIDSVNIYDGLYAYYKFNENTGTTVYDSAGFGRNGTISGATWASDGNNVTTQGYNVLLNLLGLNNSLVYYNNGSLVANALNGLLGLNFYNNATAYVLDNFNLTEGVSRQNTPLWFSYSSPGEKHIASNLTGTINATVVIDVTGINPKDVRYVSHSGLYTKTYGPGDYIYDAGAHTITLTVNGIEPATGSNVLYVDQVEDDDVRSSSDSGGGITVSQAEQQKNPASVIAVYPAEWMKGSDVHVTIKSFDSQNNSYTPKNVSFIVPKGIKLKSLLTNQSDSIATFTVLYSIDPGAYVVSALVTGDKIVQKDIYISIVDPKMTVQTKTLDGNKKDVLTQNKISLTYMVLGIAGFFILIIVVVLILAASKDNAKG